MRVRNMVLPSAYQRVEYIESTGTQYIDSGVVGSNSITSKSVFEYVELTSNGYILACAYTTSNRCFQCSTSGTGYFRLGYGSYLEASEELAITDIKYTIETKIENNNYNMYINNSLVISLSANQSYSSYQTLYILSGNIAGTSTSNAKVKLYSCKIWDNGSLVRNFIPCYRKSDNVIGLYDLVNGVFYTNAGSGTFLKGGNVTDKCKARYTKVAQWVENQLVDFDTQVFNSDDTSYLSLTKDTTNKKLTLTCISPISQSAKINTTVTIPNGHKVILYYDLLSQLSFTLSADQNTLGEATYNYGTSTSVVANQQIKVAQVYTSNKDTATIWRIGRGSASWSVNDTMVFSNVMIIDLTLAFGEGNEPTSIDDWRVQYILNQSYIAYNTIGTTKIMYEDKGTFNPRLSLVPSAYQEVEYIESSGTQYIDTSLIADQDTCFEIKVSISEYVSNNCRLFEARATDNSVDKSLGVVCFYTSTGIQYRYDKSSSYSTILQVGDIHTFKGVKNVLYLDNQNIITTTSKTFNTGCNLCLFALNSPTSGVRSMDASIYKLYYCKLYNDTTLVRNFVPCYRKSDNEIGLYDTITQTFFTNAGTGTFTKGNNKNTII